MFVATGFNQQDIVKDGLVLWLDANDKTSYPGTGTTWTDLSRGGNNGTLTNGPTFNSGNGGSIVFDGTNDLIKINNGNGINIGNIFTTFVWVKFNSYNTVLLGSNDFSDAGYPLYVENANNLYIAAGGTYIGITTANLSTNQWFYLTVVRNNTSIIWYKNGINIGTATLGSSSSNILKSVGNYNNGGFPLNGNIAQTLIYTQALSSQEVLQNYNANKNRFGL
jgi:hypothetical protein